MVTIADWSRVWLATTLPRVIHIHLATRGEQSKLWSKHRLLFYLDFAILLATYVNAQLMHKGYHTLLTQPKSSLSSACNVCEVLHYQFDDRWKRHTHYIRPQKTQCIQRHNMYTALFMSGSQPTDRVIIIERSCNRRSSLCSEASQSQRQKSRVSLFNCLRHETVPPASSVSLLVVTPLTFQEQTCKNLNTSVQMCLQSECQYMCSAYLVAKTRLAYSYLTLVHSSFGH